MKLAVRAARPDDLDADALREQSAELRMEATILRE